MDVGTAGAFGVVWTLRGDPLRGSGNYSDRDAPGEIFLFLNNGDFGIFTGEQSRDKADFTGIKKSDCISAVCQSFYVQKMFIHRYGFPEHLP